MIGIALLVMAGCRDGDSLGGTPLGLSARFDYSVPARFKVPDPLSPEGQYEIYADGPLHPDRWPVRLNACASTGSIVKYHWSIEGSPAGSVTGCDDFVYDFPAERTYSVSLVTEDDVGGKASHTDDVVVRDLLIFGVGDSYASGEGNPDVRVSLAAIAALEAARADLEAVAAALAATPQDPGLTQDSLDGATGAAASTDAASASAAYETAAANVAEALAIAKAEWQNRRCHRSAHSGQVRAARLLEDADPHSSVTFVHLACSGARVHRGLLGEYLGIEPDGPPFPPQIDRVAELADGHEIDALLLSIGGNDVNFSKLIEACILGEDCHEGTASLDPALQQQAAVVCPLLGSFASDCLDYFDSLDPAALDARAIFDVHSISEDVNGNDLRQDGNDDLPDNYRELAAEIVGRLGMDPARVYLTEVPDVTRNEVGQFCGWDTALLPSAALLQLPGVSQAEMAWASTYALAQLQATMQAAADEHGWQLVTGIAARFQRHGYCSLDGWLVRLQDTFLIQGDENGALHPNLAGHEAYATAIVGYLAP